MLAYGNPNREFLPLLKEQTFLDSLLPELTNIPFPDPNTQEAVDEINKLISLTNSLSDDSELYKRYRLYDTNYDQYIVKVLSNKGISEEETSLLLGKIYNDVIPLIVKLKFHFQRVRPAQLANLFRMSLYSFGSYYSDCPSYPSGHAILSEVYSEVLGNYHPQYYKQLKELSKDIAQSRLCLGVHYPSDCKFSSYIAQAIINHPDFKKKYKL